MILLLALAVPPVKGSVKLGRAFRPSGVKHTNELGETVLYTRDFGVASVYECRETESETHCRFRLYRTDDAGNSWRDVTSHRLRGGDVAVHDFQWLNNRRGWVVTNDCAMADAFLYRTEDGGASWNRVPVGTVGC
ncbi:MAG: Photosynthesis system assembly factor, partial [Actinomycetota bacterium]|nr:Photosynthesis system assembly factor [Actinomycetota bacterium]